MKIIRNRLLPIGKDFYAINLFGILFVKPYASLNPVLLNLERIHSRQMRELLYIPFYILYVAEWLLRLVQKRGDGYLAYRSISFEKEAYENERKLDYLHKRPRFAQWRRK